MKDNNNIIIDNIIFSLQRNGGISVVWYEMIKRLLNEVGLNMKFIEISGSENNLRDKLRINRNQILKIYPYSLFVRYINPTVKQKKPFIFHSTYFRTCSNKLSTNITTVHDFTYEFYSIGLKRKVHSHQKFNAIRNSEYIICISENTKKDLFHFLPEIEPERVHVIPNGVSSDYFILNESGVQLNEKFIEKNSYNLFVGSRAKYKNFELVVKACSKTNKNLVIVGSPLTSSEIQFIKNHTKEESIIYAGGVSNETLNRLYNNAYSLIYPSSYEGFGIPILEAQRAGCPVIAFNKSSIPEVIGDSRLLINDLNQEELLSKLELLQNIDLKRSIINDGLDNSKKYSWDNTYNKLFSLYKRIWSETL